MGDVGGEVAFVSADHIDVLVVEDTLEYAHLLTTVLSQAGYRVRLAATGRDALVAVEARPPDLVILDLVLPDYDGLDLCREFSTHTDASVIIVSVKADEVDRVLGLKFGADDYVTKPFSARELLARIEALLRRRRTPTSVVRKVGELTLFPSSRQVQIAGDPVTLTRVEFDLLAALLDNQDAVLTRDELLNTVWGTSHKRDLHLVDAHVSNLRRKIDPPSGRSYIRAVRGVGYGITRDSRVTIR